MKTIFRNNISLSMAAMLLTAALAVPAAAESEAQHLYLTGAMQGYEKDVPQGSPPSTLAVDGSAPGLATNLGNCTVTWKLTVNLANGSATGTFQFTGANGDTINTRISGQGTPALPPGLNRIVEINTITGGTGQVAGAKGSFIMERLIDLNTGFTSGSFHGMVILPGTGH
jgi:hypothetical protein